MGILCLMHLARPYGHLLVAGRAPEPEEIARLARCTIEEVEALLLELENNQVFRRTPMGVLVSPRLLQDEAARQQHIQNGKKGGNPVLIGDRINKGNADLALEGAEREHLRRERAAERQRRHRAKKKELGHVMSRDVASFSVTRHVTLHGGNSVKAALPERDTSTKDAETSWFVTEVKGGRCVAGSMDVTGDKAQKPESRILDRPVTVALGHMRIRGH